MAKGWKSESARHSLARRGIETGRRTSIRTLQEKISKKERELNYLLTEKENLELAEKKSVLTKKDAPPMEKTKFLLKQDFISSSVETEQFREFYNVFKKEFTELLKPFITKIEFSKGHFEVTGFFKTKKGIIYYFSLGDVRWDKKEMMYRTAQTFTDYTGGANQFVSTDKIETIVSKIRGK